METSLNNSNVPCGGGEQIPSHDGEEFDLLQFNQILICQVCHDYFNSSGKIPRVLKCGHSFCDDCLGECLKFKSDGHLDGLTYPCPTCKTRCDIRNFKALPTNFQILQDQNLIKKFNQARLRFTNDNITCSIEDRHL